MHTVNDFLGGCTVLFTKWNAFPRACLSFCNENYLISTRIILSKRKLIYKLIFNTLKKANESQGLCYEHSPWREMTECSLVFHYSNPESSGIGQG